MLTSPFIIGFLHMSSIWICMRCCRGYPDVTFHPLQPCVSRSRPSLWLQINNTQTLHESQTQTDLVKHGDAQIKLIFPDKSWNLATDCDQSFRRKAHSTVGCLQLYLVSFKAKRLELAWDLQMKTLCRFSVFPRGQPTFQSELKSVRHTC